jgi:hypothetical protein
LQHIELIALSGRREVVVFDVADDRPRVDGPVVDVRALVDAG